MNVGGVVELAEVVSEEFRFRLRLCGLVLGVVVVAVGVFLLRIGIVLSVSSIPLKM